MSCILSDEVCEWCGHWLPLRGAACPCGIGAMAEKTPRVSWWASSPILRICAAILLVSFGGAAVCFWLGQVEAAKPTTKPPTDPERVWLPHRDHGESIFSGTVWVRRGGQWVVWEGQRLPAPVWLTPGSDVTPSASNATIACSDNGVPVYCGATPSHADPATAPAAPAPGPHGP